MVNSPPCPIPVGKPRDAAKVGVAQCAALIAPYGMSVPGQREAIMRERFSGSTITAAMAGAAVSVVISVSATPASAQAAPPALATPWGEPDLPGLCTDQTDTTPQRS